MSSDKATDKNPGAPSAKKPEGAAFDLFKTFRHPPKAAEPIRAPKAAAKTKG